MIDFIKGFLYEGFVPGDYTMGTVHTFALFLSAVSIPIIILLLRNKDEAYVNRKMKIIAFIAITIYISNRVVMVSQGTGFEKAFWPYYLCNVNTVFMSIYILFDIKKGKDFMMITGISGAVLAFIIPAGIFDDKFLTLNILDSVMSHYEIVAIPLILMGTKAYKLDVKRSLGVIAGLFAVAINVEFLQPIMINEQVDYLFIDGNLPFTIAGVHQFYVMLFSAVVYVYVCYFINYAYTGRLESLVNRKKLANETD